MKLSPSRRRLLARVGYRAIGDSPTLTIAEERAFLRELEEMTIPTADGDVHLFRRGVELQYEPAGTGPDDCEMVRLVLAQDATDPRGRGVA